MKKFKNYRLSSKLSSKYLQDFKDFEGTETFKKFVARVALNLLEDYEEQKIKKDEIAEVFLFFQLYSNDHFPNLENDDTAFFDLLYDGVIFHSSHHDFGERLIEMRNTANKILHYKT